VRLTVPPDLVRQPWREELRKRPVVPQQFAGKDGGTVYALTSDGVAGELGAMGFDVDLLGEAGLPETTDLYLLRDDVAARSGFLSSRGEAGRTFAAADSGHRRPRIAPEQMHDAAALVGGGAEQVVHAQVGAATRSNSRPIRSCGTVAAYWTTETARRLDGSRVRRHGNARRNRAHRRR
jgi:hypothetical protein